MRRSVFFLTPLLPLILTACEDGPNQTFQPATGTLFNNGDTLAAVSDAGDPLTSTFSASTSVQICSGAELQQQWSAMVAQPLAPVRFMAGVDLDNGPNFPLLTVEQAELGPTYPVENACVAQPPAKTLNDGAYGATPGAQPAPNDTCLYSSGTTLRTQAQCAAYEQSILTGAAVSGKTPQCAWNVIPATSSYLQSNPAPTRLCQPTVLGAGGNGSDVGGSILVQWGNNGEFQMEWAVPTHKSYVMYLNPGYVGQMQWNYVDPATKAATVHSYQYEISLPIKKDGNNFEIDWLTGSAYPNQVDELYRGIASTYAPDIYDDAAPGVTCNTTGTCLAYANAEDGTGRALFGMRPVSFYMFFNPPTLPDPSGFTVNSAYLFNIKYAPYSGITSYFKMYDGPIDGGGIAAGGDAAAAEPFGDGLVGNQVPQKHCHFGMGNSFENLLTSCINVFQPPSGCATVGSSCDTINQTAQNKVLGDLAHDDQNYTFAVVGINQNFRPVKLDVCTPALCGGGAVVNGVCKTPGANTTNCGTDIEDVIHDTDSPLTDPNNNFANSFSSDVRSFGAIQNDYFPPGSAPWGQIPCTAKTQATDCAGLAAPDIAYVGVPAVCDTTTGDPNDGFCVAAAYGKDTHGSGAVWREFGRLVQTDMNSQFVAQNGGNAAFKKSWHDATCYFPEGCISAAGVVDPTITTASACAAASPPAPADPNSWVAAEAAPTLLPMEMTPFTSCCNPNVTTGATACIAANQGSASATCAAITPGAACSITGGAGIVKGTCTVPFDVNTWRAAPGCTGFESWITGAEAAPSGNGILGSSVVTTGAADDSWDIPFWGAEGIGGGFKPGTPQGMFCNDPGPGLAGFFNYCGLSGDVQGVEGDLLGVSTNRLLQYLGNGDTLNLPLEGRDRRYFFKQWSIAYAKYETSPSVLDTGINSAGSSAPGQNGLQVDNGAQVELGAVANQYVDTDDFIFDSFGGGASRSEFIDFAVANANNDPVDIEQKILVLGSNLQATNWYRKLDREERALFNALAVDKTQASWGYLAGVTDFWPADAAWQPAAACTPASCATIAASVGYRTAAAAAFPSAPPLTCDVVATDTNVGLCGYAYPHHNANPFLTNLAGSAILVNGVSGIPGGWALPGAGVALNPAPAGWIDPCNPVSVPAATCTVDNDCPGVMACASGTCVAAVTPYYCATHSASNDPFLQSTAGSGACSGTSFGGAWTAPVSAVDGSVLRRANGKPMLEGYCGVWQPNPFALTTNAITPNVTLFPGSKNANPLGVAPGIEIVKTFPSDGEALVSLPTFPNPYNGDPTTNKNPVLVMVPWLPQQEGVGYPVSTNGSQDIFVTTAQLDFTGQVITPTMDYFPAALSCFSSATCTNGQTCIGADPTTSPPTSGQCLTAGSSSQNLTAPYGVSIQAWETQDFLGEVFLCIDPVTSANRLASTGAPGDILSAHMYSSAETIIDWLATHPGAQNSCQVIVRYSPYDNYPDFISSLTGGVRLDIEQGAGYGRVVDVTLFAPGSGVAATP